jgi:flagellar basal-body rod protein FlgB
MVLQLSNLTIEGALAPLSTMIGGISQAQKATANNIANINTPGYKPQHIDLPTASGVEANPFETKLSRQLGGSQLPTLLAQRTGQEDSVNLQEEFLAMQKNLLLYNVVSKRLTTIITNLKASGNIGR